MPTLYEIHAEIDLVLLTHVGQVVPADQQDALNSLARDPAFHRGMKVLIDCSGVTGNEGSLDSLLARRQTHGRDLAGLDRPARWGYYAPGDLAYGLCRRAQTVFAGLENLEIGVFRTAPETLDFLGLEPGRLPGWPRPVPGALSAADHEY